MSHFLARFDGTEKQISFEPNVKSLEGLLEEVSASFGIPPGQFKLRYKDVENDEIEIVDQLDFEYFVSLSQETQIELTIASDFKPKSLSAQNPFKKDRDAPAEPTVELIGSKDNQEQAKPAPEEKPRLPTPQPEDDFLHALEQEPEHKIAEKNLKTLNECLSDAEVLTDLKKKVESIRQIMEQSLVDMKGELVRTKRKNSGIVSREIDSAYVHNKVICSNCGLNPINGKRFKCIVCKNFELCEVCEENNFHSHHPMMRLAESVKGPAYYDELAQLIKMAMGNLRVNDLFLKKKLIKGVFGDHVTSETIDVMLNAKVKCTAEDLLLEFHKLLI